MESRQAITSAAPHLPSSLLWPTFQHPVLETGEHSLSHHWCPTASVFQGHTHLSHPPLIPDFLTPAHALSIITGAVKEEIREKWCPFSTHTPPA